MSTRVGHVHDLCPHTTLKNSLKTFGYNYAYLMLAVSGPVLVDPSKGTKGPRHALSMCPKTPSICLAFVHPHHGNTLIPRKTARERQITLRTYLVLLFIFPKTVRFPFSLVANQGWHHSQLSICRSRLHHIQIPGQNSGSMVRA